MTNQSHYIELRNRVGAYLDQEPTVSDEQLKGFIEEMIFTDMSGYTMTTQDRLQLAAKVFHSFRGLDVLQRLMDDATIAEIMINAVDEVYIERGGLIYRSDVQFESIEKLESLIQTMVGKVNRAVNESNPIVDARLPNGARMNVVLPPVALRGPVVTIRKFPASTRSLEQLAQLGAMSDEAAAMLRQLVLQRRNVFISGGTGTGKTTLLNALAQQVSENERIVTIEDSAELRITGVPNLVSLETRNANSEGKGAISIRDLIRASLRMRPDRIIVGEVRGPEAYDMLQAMNSGHAGSLSTGHANSVPDMLRRLEMMVMSAVSIPLEAIRRQIHSAIDVMVHLARDRDGKRKVTAIMEIGPIEQGEITLKPMYMHEQDDIRCAATSATPEAILSRKATS